MNESRQIGYPSDEPCYVCLGYKNNQSEPRFCYTVCEDHQNVLPVEVSSIVYERTARILNERRNKDKNNGKD